MKSGYMALIGRFLRALYQERQVYLRSDGRVQFMSLSPLVQLMLLAGAIPFFTWVGYSSVNVVFKEQIIAAKERKFVKMQGGYEERLAEMEHAYEELNGMLIRTQEDFLTKTAELEARHANLVGLWRGREAVGRELGELKSLLTESVSTARNNKKKKNSNRLVMRPGNAPTALQTGLRGEETATIDLALVPSMVREGGDGGSATAEADRHWHQVAAVDDRLTELYSYQLQLIDEIEETTDQRITEIESIISVAGIEPSTLLGRLGRNSDGLFATGGPLINLGGFAALAGSDEEESDEDRQLVRVSHNFDRISNLHAALGALPLAVPLRHYRLSSNYGPRIDPFRKTPAFHSGADLAAPANSRVRATANGVVTFAGKKAAYGRVVEIDHGNGLKTRYGHLRSYSVKRGEKIKFQQIIGRVGSSGRSTGPHVHYEIWWNGKTQNPRKFFQAGEYVLKSQG